MADSYDFTGMASETRRLSDGSKPPTIPRWLLIVMLFASVAMWGYVLAQFVGFFEFFHELRRHGAVGGP